MESREIARQPEAAKEAGTGIYPRLNPAYWDDHLLGAGETERKPGKIESHRAMLFSVNAIKKACSTGLPTWPIKSYEDGQVFPLEEYAPGTMVVFNRERIARDNNSNRPADMNDYRGQALPEHPVNLELDLANQYLKRYGVRHLAGGELVYSDAVCIGVVSKNILGRKILAGIHGGSVVKDRRTGRINVPLLDQVAEPVIKVGKVNHYGKKLGSTEECLTRVNALEVRALGKPAVKSFYIPGPLHWNS